MESVKITPFASRPSLEPNAKRQYAAILIRRFCDFGVGSCEKYDIKSPLSIRVELAS